MNDYSEYEILVTGVVQGVGFRPAIYGIATMFNIKGMINNSSDGVKIVIHACEETKMKFISEIWKLTIPGMRIDSIYEERNPKFRYKFSDFTINKSSKKGGSTDIPVDSVMCEECKDDFYDETSDRYLYPLTACTKCGPRITVINRMPYDRRYTMMSYIERCPKCKKSYLNPGESRRFNFETDSCWDCTPWIGLVNTENKQYMCIRGPRESELEEDLIEKGYTCTNAYANSGTEIKKIRQHVLELFDRGCVMAIKGVGGYQLVADAGNNEAVNRIRLLKKRPKKPLAVMFPSIEMIRDYCVCTKEQEKILLSRNSPIVLLKMKKNSDLSHALTYDIQDLGAMLPSSPTHELLVDRPLVMTSANISGEPLIYDDDISKLAQIADAVFIHDRKISMSIDDSVVKDSALGNIILRYSRGYVPTSFSINRQDEGIAFGSDMKSSFSLLLKNKAICSQYIGDLKYESVQERYDNILKKYVQLFNPSLKTIYVDKHPYYYSSMLGKEYAKKHGLKVVEIQHHFAHALAVMAEHSLEGKYLASILDGTGYGDDNAVWGGEVYSLTRYNYKRLCYLRYISLIGGEKAIKQPYRLFFSIEDELNEIYLSEFDDDFIKSQVGTKIMSSVAVKKNGNNFRKMLRRATNCVYTSSAGRLFDLAAFLLLGVEQYDFEAEAATLVEQEAQEYINEQQNAIHSHGIVFNDDTLIERTKAYINIGKKAVENDTINTVLLLAYSLRALEETDSKRYACFVFHILLASAITQSILLNDKADIEGYILAGGVYQNAVLRDMTVALLKDYGKKEIFYNIKITPSDGSISLGQGYFGDIEDET